MPSTMTNGSVGGVEASDKSSNLFILPLAERAHMGSEEITEWCPTCKERVLTKRGCCLWCDRKLSDHQPDESQTLSLEELMQSAPAPMPVEAPEAPVRKPPQPRKHYPLTVRWEEPSRLRPAPEEPDEPETELTDDDIEESPEELALPEIEDERDLEKALATAETEVTVQPVPEPLAEVETSDSEAATEPQEEERAPGVLNLGRGFELPLDAATQSIAILAVKGAGKSNAAAVMAEEYFAEGIPWVVIDPKGDWWGIRESTEEHSGLDVVILGGLHGDHPLPYTSGRTVARMIASRNLTCVLDISLMDEEEERPQFMSDFGSELFSLHHNDPQVRHIFLEEAHEVVPEGATRNERPMLNAWAKVVLLGRNHGLGVTLVSQRTAGVANRVLTQTGCLIALRTTSPDDQKKIQGWLKFHPDSKKIVEDLPRLKNGQARIVSPAWLGDDTIRIAQFRRRKTFDSGGTPEVPEDRESQVLSESDIADIGLELSGNNAKESDETDFRSEPKTEPVPARKMSLGERKAVIRESLASGPKARAQMLLDTGLSRNCLFRTLKLMAEDGEAGYTGRKASTRWFLTDPETVTAAQPAGNEGSTPSSSVDESEAVEPEIVEPNDVHPPLEAGANQLATILSSGTAAVAERLKQLDAEYDGVLLGRYLKALIERIESGEMSPEFLDRFERIAGFS